MMGLCMLLWAKALVFAMHALVASTLWLALFILYCILGAVLMALYGILGGAIVGGILLAIFLAKKGTFPVR